MAVLLKSKILDFFNDVSEFVEDVIDMIELDPIMLSEDTYVTGFRRLSTSYTARVEAHIKKMKTLNIKIQDKENEKWLTEPEEEAWISVVLFDGTVMDSIFNQFKSKFDAMTSFDILNISYRDKGSSDRKAMSIIFQSKRVGCKMALQLRKKYDSVSQVFKHFGQSNPHMQAIHAKTEYELALAE